MRAASRDDPSKGRNALWSWTGRQMREEKFIDIEEETPEPGEYCTIKVVSYFKGKYLPSCKAWSWLMDEQAEPKSHVVAWKRAKPKEGYYEYIQSDDCL